MRSTFSCCAFLACWAGLALSGAVASQEKPESPKASEEQIREKIGRLGSEKFKEREAALKWLRERPESEKLLRKAMPLATLEASRRMAQILDYIERQPVRDLQEALKEGDILRFIDLLADWPDGKYEPEAWQAVCTLSHTLTELHERKKAKGNNLPILQAELTPHVVSGKTIVGRSRKPGTHDEYHFVRGHDVKITDSKGPNVLVASTPLEFSGDNLYSVILARSSVELKGRCVRCILISGGDVTLHSNGVIDCMIIARGKLTFAPRIHRSHLVSAEAISLRASDSVTITENEPNPLGFIRFVERNE